ncbi:abortive infection family protein [Mycobacterium nebraskense]|nr:abortive infection family protein [Mycobacterium nebraskense]
MTDSTVGAISTAFQDEGFAPDPDCRYEDSSVRRRTAQSYLDGVDWTDPRQAARFLRVAERLLNGWEPVGLSQFHQSLRRDGYQVDDQTGQITPAGPQLSIESIARFADPSAIREGFDRIRRAISDDTALAVGSAKELIESTAKVVLCERGQVFDDKADLPKLARAAQLSLGLDPSTGSGPDGSDGVKRILGAVTTIANGLADLRNRGLGTGHGPATARVGLGVRHAHLAVNAALTWCQLMLDTLADPDAPWRKGHS